MSWYRGFFIALISAAALLWSTGTDAATLRATVVDAETAEPLEGVVIVVIWYRPILYPLAMDNCYKFHDAAEVVSDSRGDFSLDLSALWVIRRLKVVFFKPGYRGVTLWGEKSGDIAIPENQIIRLTKSKTLQDQIRESGDILVCSSIPTGPDPWCVPAEKIRNFVRLRDLQRKIFGDQND